MLNELPEFWDYITTDARGVMNGIREDTPDYLKEDYYKYLKEEKERQKIGLKI